jgi:PEP-CTERM motif
MKFGVALFLGAAVLTSVSSAQADPVFGGTTGDILTPSSGCPGASGGLVANAGFECYETTEVVVNQNDPPKTIFVDFPGWVFSSDFDDHGVAFDPHSHSGDAAAYLAGASNVDPSTLSQTIATTPGQLYKVDFWYVDPPGAPSITVKRTGTTIAPGPCLQQAHFDGQFTASFGGTTLVQTARALDSDGCYETALVPDWTEVTGYIVGTGSDTLFFSYFTEFLNSWMVDDVSVTAVDSIPPPAGIPEPATLALMAAGLAGFGALRRRRARR